MQGTHEHNEKWNMFKKKKKKTKRKRPKWTFQR